MLLHRLRLHRADILRCRLFVETYLLANTMSDLFEQQHERDQPVGLRPIDQVAAVRKLKGDMKRVKEHVKRLHDARNISPETLDRTVNI